MAGYAGVAAWLGVRSLGWPLVHDAPILHYIAWRIGEGAVPYRDLFDMNFPGTYLLHLGIVRALGTGDAAWRAFDLGWLAGTAAVLAVLARPWGRAASATGAMIFVVYHLGNGAWQAGQRDYLLVIFLALSGLGVARWAEGGGRSSVAWGGLALGAGLTIKPHALLFGAGLVTVIVVIGLRGRFGAVVPAALFIAAAAVVPLLVAGWVAAAGGLAAWRDIVAHYLVPLYSRLGRPPAWTFHRWTVWIPLAIAAGLSLALAVRAGRTPVRLAIVVLGLAYGVAHHAGQGKGWEYHLYPLLGFTALASAAGLGGAAAAAARPGRAGMGRLALMAVLAVALAMLAQKGAEASNPEWIATKREAVAGLARDLAPLGPGERVQVLDTTAGGVHALLRLGAPPPTRFIYDFHFFHDEDTAYVRALRAELMGTLQAQPPRYVVVFREGWPGGGAERVQRFPELARLLDEAYEERHARPAYLVYEKRRRP